MYRLRHTERKVYIVFYAHPISGVFFCFSWKALEYESNGKFSKPERRIFYDDRNYNTFEK